MKTRNLFMLVLLMAPGVNALQAQGLSATEIVRKADEKFNGEESSYSLMAMTIIRPAWERTIEFKSWTLGKDHALALITAPAKEAGQTFLKRESEMWRWDPTISRLIKLPPSMMSQGWMGSDYTNDDILRESSIVKDYDHEIIGEERQGGRLCYKIRMTAREDASIVWGKQIQWIDKEEFLVLKAELYDEDGYLVRTETGSDIKVMDGRTITSRIELIPEEEPENRTIIEIREISFNIPLEESFFSQQNMQRVH
ncbi:MAG: outer membrane lipoprotein-sorting protein [Bacteroides sp.]|nr:outer membrane lipoprotein-sorting protein [Bacteroides sp.]